MHRRSETNPTIFSRYRNGLLAILAPAAGADFAYPLADFAISSACQTASAIMPGVTLSALECRWYSANWFSVQP